MNKKIILKYVFICLPFIVGGGLFCFGIYNIVSSLLFFVGGYIAFKNLFDYRKIKKNVNLASQYNIVNTEKDSCCKNYNNVCEIKRNRRHHKVRKRVKNIDF